MEMALKIQLQILNMSGIKPNFSKIAREYDIDRRTVKKYYDEYSLFALKNLPIVLASLGNSAGMYGSVRMVKR